MNKIVVHGSFESGKTPVYSSAQASGADIEAFLTEPLLIKAGQRAIVPTGITIEIPEGYEAQIRPRSGLANRHGITVLNSPGTIDADYRGEVKIILINTGDTDFTINPGDRIAQIVFSPVIRAEFYPNARLSETDRGEGGFGSTGT
ncbi:MAG: dUTP diphosphatase [Spirochaetota bacterium]|nr:dUTP diphosphatase [Spirochaetota bacterium]